MSENVCNESNATTCSYSLAVEPGLKRRKIQRQSPCHIFRYETNEQLLILRKILGWSVTYGLRKKPPRLRDAESQTLERNDIANVVIGSDQVEQPFTRYTNKRGIDLIFDGMYMIVCIRYEKYIYDHDRSGRPINLPGNSTDLEQFITRDGDSYRCQQTNVETVDTIKCGELFFYEWKMYEVAEETPVTSDTINCVEYRNNNVHRMFDLTEEIKAAINSFAK